MKLIQVLGPGCQKCKQLAERVENAVNELGLACQVEKVEDIAEIVEFGVMMTPALTVDGKTLISGKVPSVEEIKKLLSE